MGHAVQPGPDFERRWKLSSLIGEGGMGAVYLAEPVDGGPPVAAKFLTRRADTESLERFIREGQVMHRIRHPNVVSVLATGEHEGYPWLVLELVSGGSLATRLKDHGRLGASKAAAITADVLRGLTACHAQSILHRDLKPGNVLLTSDLRAKIADLGIAYDEGRETQLTAAGNIIGTPLYMAPEVLVDGEAWSAAADIYAAGVLLYEMLCGRPPVQGENLVEICARHNVPRSRLEFRAPEVPAALAKLADRATARKPQDRPKTVADFLAELEAAAPESTREPEREESVALVPAPGKKLVLGGVVSPQSDRTIALPAPFEEEAAPAPSRAPTPLPPVALHESIRMPSLAVAFLPLLLLMLWFADDWFVRLWCLVVAGFIGGAVVPPFRRVLANAPALVIDGDGFEDLRLGIGAVPWTEVRKIKASESGSKIMVRIALIDHRKYSNTTIFGRLAGRLERHDIGGDLYVNAAMLSMSAAELARLLEKHWRAARPLLPAPAVRSSAAPAPGGTAPSGRTSGTT